MASRKSKSDAEREKVIQNRLQELLTRMLQDEDNKYCVDCDAKGPRWASWNIGIFVCIRCAGIHRNLGVHISKVKSVNLDSWTPMQVSRMQIMGNSRARAVYEANLPEGFRRPQADSPLDVFIRAKYEKKKYIAREWVPAKAPELPEGWTALIEAEKQKKDIRSIVLPSHTSNEDIVKRERQSPKEVTKKTESSKAPSTATTAPAVTSATEKKTPAAAAAPAVANPLESDFDLLSLSQQPGQPQTVPTKPAIANDLLGLGDGSTDNNSEFDEFVGAQKSNTTTPKAETKTNGNQNGTSNQSLFDDFNIVNSGNESQDAGKENAQKQTMSKDSIMALFNQKPAASAVVHPANPQQQFPGNFMTGNNVSTMPGMQIPANFGGLQGNGTSGNLGGNMGLFGGMNQPQPFQQTVGGPGIGPGMMNNPFLSMSQPARSDQNNVFGGFSTATPGANQNFLQ